VWVWGVGVLQRGAELQETPRRVRAASEARSQKPEARSEGTGGVRFWCGRRDCPLGHFGASMACSRPRLGSGTEGSSWGPAWHGTIRAT
jgi:hypothetical protein